MSPEEETGLGEHASAWDVVEDPYGDPEGFWTVKQEATGSASQKLPLRQVMGKRLEEIKSGTKEAHENTPVVGEAAGRWPGPRGGASESRHRRLDRFECRIFLSAGFLKIKLSCETILKFSKFKNATLLHKLTI